MITLLILFIARPLLWLRYRVQVRGLDEVVRRGQRGILFLPNHPALIDPIILVCRLYGRFKTRALADRDQIDRFMIRRLAKWMGVLPIPDISKSGSSAAEDVGKVMTQCVQVLRRGENLVLYPSGRAYRRRLEDIGGNSAVETILRELPDVRVVLVRTRGLWGSSFSWASGQEPIVGRALRNGARLLLLNGIFFCPRRHVTIELVEPDDLPRDADRSVINRYLEDFYNRDAPANTYVPYTVWERGSVRELPEPDLGDIEADKREIPATTRQIVTEYLEQLTGCRDFDDDARLGHDLGMDSLSRADMVIWLQSEFGFPPGDVDSLRTVRDVMLAACGEATSSGREELKEVPLKWFGQVGRPNRLENLTRMTITQAFLTQARKSPDKVIVADQITGPKTYRDLITAIMVLKDEIEQLPGDHMGIMMPGSVAADVLYLATLFSSKTPVMINWTLGRKNLQHCLDTVRVDRILTSRALVSRIQAQGIELAEIIDSFVCVEDVITRLGVLRKLRAWLRARVCWSELWNAEIPETAVVLFTSGSEDVPKAVPLTHENILTNVSDIYECFTLVSSDIAMCLPPPFHSFGLTIGMAVPLCLGIRAVYYPNPTDGGMLGRIIDAYKVTILVGTPTFLRGIIHASSSDQLTSLRLVVSGAEKCPQSTYEALARHCPQTVVLEGYGVTECSPVITVNREDDPRAGTIGSVMPSLEYVVVDPDTNQRAKTGETGVLLVRGPSVFAGYLNYDGPSPFVELENRRWYHTGDLVSEDEEGVLTFAGRLKRFIKLGGEMISLPAIESVLEAQLSDEGDEEPVVAVVPGADEDHPEIVLFTTAYVDRAAANRIIRDAGLSGLHNVRRVIKIDHLPLLGTGKTNYRALAETLKNDAGSA